MRARAIVLVVLGLVGLVLVGALVSPVKAPRGSTGTGATALLPVVSLSSSASRIWSCPGPLPVGAGHDKSEIALLNAGEANLVATLQVTTVSPVSQKNPVATGTAKGSGSRLDLPGRTQQIFDLPTTGPAGLASVTVVTSGSPVAVSELTIPFSGSNREAPLEAPCESGTSTKAYLLANSTLGASASTLTISNPTATPAVTDVTVFGQTAAVSPAPLQGIAVPPDGAVTVDLGRYVVQQGAFAVSVTSVSGRIAGGAFDLVSASGTSGGGFVVGSGVPEAQWQLPPGSAQAGRTLVVNILDPTSHATTVTVATPLYGKPTSQMSAQVPPQTDVSVSVPVADGSRWATTAVPGTVSEGPVSVRASGGVPILVAEAEQLPVVSSPGASSTGSSGSGSGTSGSTAPKVATVSMPPLEQASDWLVPAAATTPGLEDDVVGCNTGNRLEQASLEVVGVTAQSAPTLANFQVSPGACWSVPLSASIAESLAVGLEVSSSGPMVVDQVFAIGNVASVAVAVPGTR